MSSSQCDEQIKFPKYVRAIIATKGLPCTWKTTIAMRMGDWARCHVLYIDHFLDALSVEKGFTADFRPSKEEGKRINRVAIEALWKAAARHLHKDYGSNCVIVKSSLSSSFELDLLARLANKLGDLAKVIVIDCQMKNEHRYRLEMERRVSLSSHLEWCKASSWKDIVRAREADDCLLDDDHAWDQHMKDLIKGDITLSYWGIHGFRFVRLVVDTYEDIRIYKDRNSEISSDFRDAITYLMNELTYVGFVKDGIARYQVVEFRELRRFRLEMKLRMPLEKSKYLCATNGRDNCLFKYCNDEDGEYNCGVCEERVEGLHQAYTCHFCFLTLHKSCAERCGNIDFLWGDRPFLSPTYPYKLSTHTVAKYPCKSCFEGGKSFSYKCQSCLFQTHLKAKMLPTIINHDSHPEHFLSLQFPINNHMVHICKACGKLQIECGYACNICKFYCHTKCIFHDQEILHQHGGYKHVMKLKFSHDGMDPEESYWCDTCYEDLDPQDWFYVCTGCPYYVAHTQCPRDNLEDVTRVFR